MKAFNMIFVAILVAAHFFLLTAGNSWAITSSEALFAEVDIGGGLWRYHYTLYNTSDPVTDVGYDVYDFFLKIDPTATITDVVSPAGWDQINDSSSFIEWFSTLPGEPPTGSDIVPGASLGGFDFSSDTRLSSLYFESIITNPIDPSTPVVSAGNTSSVPEPSIVLLLTVGAFVLVSFKRKLGPKSARY
jgi:hypothetical protein